MIIDFGIERIEQIEQIEQLCNMNRLSIGVNVLEAEVNHENFEYLKTIADSNDRRAILTDLMNAFGEDVWRYAYSITRKRDHADDITQDVFLKVYNHLFAFRGDSSVKTWILTITRNTAYDYKRKAFFRKVVLTDNVEYREYQQSHQLN